jgi:3-methyl-2-oxobutanoate hydroxymethyltransferase
VQGRDAATAQRLLYDAKALEEAGACAVVLELVPAALAGRITAALKIPTIGIGAGPECDGQVQVMYDILGYGAEGEFIPKHAKVYADLGTAARAAIGRYTAEVRAGEFPTEAQSFEVEDRVLAALDGEADSAAVVRGTTTIKLSGSRSANRARRAVNDPATSAKDGTRGGGSPVP